MAESSSTDPPAYCRFIDTPSPFPCVDATMRFGDNAAGGISELLLGTAQGHLTWDDNLANGVSSGWCSVEARANTGGGPSLNVARGQASASVTNNNITYGNINSVQIVAFVAGAQKQFFWRSIVVKFYRNGVLRQTISRPPECQPKANTYPPANVGMQVSEYVPDASDNDSVVVTGQVMMNASAVEVDADELKGSVLVFADNCSGA